MYFGPDQFSALTAGSIASSIGNTILYGSVLIGQIQNAGALKGGV